MAPNESDVLKESEKHKLAIKNLGEETKSLGDNSEDPERAKAIVKILNDVDDFVDLVFGEGSIRRDLQTKRQMIQVRTLSRIRS
ncbi:hypothetical protein HBI40_237680 [Parastagonospora nodorum]|nr:hypothetical protein HBI12_207760 [Parastagonospora nodorum]KAH6199392.1 hypothetical protein HBI43_230130 [Parastagonospora nodorum]KAH6242420.1 hypothetical protein HBI42_233540 [Parastagonospora nodorum]KAH6245065.1 hypothetical protein HBI41_244590 [Parastagonospora nodorum]KAH6262344.1 hypothetical protein HBI40_237680 [Parastagonospora nodorum]